MITFSRNHDGAPLVLVNGKVAAVAKDCKGWDYVKFWCLAFGAPSKPTFQARVQPWMLECFGAEIAADKLERNHRFYEEATELVQAGGMTRDEAHQLVDYTYSRPVGEKSQEVGGVKVTLASWCLAHGLDMHACAETELARILQPEVIEKIRAKQASKPKHSPLPEATQPGDQNG